jgi:hypothetical protein
MVYETLQTGDINKLLNMNCQRVRNIYNRLSTSFISDLPLSSIIYLSRQCHIALPPLYRCTNIDLTGISAVDVEYFLINHHLYPSQFDVSSVSVNDERLRILLRFADHKTLENYVKQHRCQIVDIIHIPLSLHQLSDPMDWLLNWCTHCRQKLLPYDQCVQCVADLEIICHLLDQSLHIPSIVHNHQLITYIITHPLMTPDFIALLIKHCEIAHIFVSNREKILKIQYHQHRHSYRPDIHEFYSFSSRDLGIDDFIRYPHLIRETTPEEWSQWLAYCDHEYHPQVIMHLRQIYPQIISQYQTIMSKYDAIKINWEHPQKKCCCGRKLSLTCGFDKCGTCCACPHHKNHHRKVRSLITVNINRNPIV